VNLSQNFYRSISIGLACLACIGGVVLGCAHTEKSWAASSGWQSLQTPDTGGGFAVSGI